MSAGSVAERTTGSMSSAGGKEVVNWTKGREIEGLLAVGTSPGCQQRKRGCCTGFGTVNISLCSAHHSTCFLLRLRMIRLMLHCLIETLCEYKMELETPVKMTHFITKVFRDCSYSTL